MAWSDWLAFVPDEIKKVPDRKGVYQLGTLDEVLYIGQSENLRRRLSEHFDSTDSCVKKTTIFRYYETPYPRSEEEELLKQYKSVHGRLPKCNEQST